MSTAIDPESMSWMRRVRNTPMRDVLRGRITGRLDVQRLIERSDLPAVARELVSRVVRRTRLWGLEKVDVAQELIAHFRDGLDAGETIDELVQSFGDEKLAAKMIRRAKRRNRPLAWHVFHGIGIVLGALVLAYTGLAIHFYMGRPSPRVLYLADMNSAAAAIPREQRGWPLYQRAMLGLAQMFSGFDSREDEPLFIAEPGSRRWPELIEWMNAHAGDVDLIRQAAAKPVAGFKRTIDFFTRDPEATLMPRAPLNVPIDTDDTPLFAQGTPASIGLFQLGWVLHIDAQVAIDVRDGARLIADVEALHAIKRQLTNEDVPFRHFPEWPLSPIEDALVRSPSIFDDAALVRLAHELSIETTAADLLSYENDRILFRDIVQRTYTDDGAGDGRLTLDGVRRLAHGSTLQTPAVVLLGVAAPAAMLVSPSRRDLIAAYDRILDHANALVHEPIREADWASVYREIAHLKSQFVLVPLFDWTEDLQSRHAHAERYLGRRDGIVTAIALELYRRAHDAYPSSLDQLVPTYLPRVPLDRIDGNPIRFRVVNGRPLLYSVGVDRDDDGGVSLGMPSGDVDTTRTADWNPPSKRNVADGDWVLFPQSTDVARSRKI